MADGQLGYVLRHIRRLMGLPGAGDLTDGQLLERFAAQHEEAAFEALLQRHGALVLGVCRRVLRDPHAQPKTTLPAATQDRIASIASELVNRLQLA